MSFGRDFEQQLSFYVEARSMFCNLEPVLVQLIHVSVQSFARPLRECLLPICVPGTSPIRDSPSAMWLLFLGVKGFLKGQQNLQLR